jgi:hypothetical protein
MTTSSKLLRRSAAVLATGGFLWVTKFVVIAATDGATSGAPNTITSVLYLSAVALMVLGLAGVGVGLMSGRHVALRICGGVVGALSWIVTYVVVDGVSKAVAGDAGPTWLSDEIGIVTTGAVLMTIGLALAKPRSASSTYDTVTV